MKRAIATFEVIDHGVEHEQYFQGCGVAFTAFEDIATGIGNTSVEALDDALDSLAQNDWVWSEDQQKEMFADLDNNTVPQEATENWVYVSIRVK